MRIVETDQTVGPPAGVFWTYFGARRFSRRLERIRTVPFFRWVIDRRDVRWWRRRWVIVAKQNVLDPKGD